MAALVAAALSSACSPTYNWRELRPDGAALVATLPCKPDQADREVPLTGQPTTLHMYSCKASDQTYALAWANLPEGAVAQEALAAWQQASQKSLQGSEGEGAVSPWPFALKGHSMLITVRTAGKDHQGHDLQAQVAYFSSGQKVYQAAVYGQQLPQEAVEPFFSGIQLLP
ncbi:hypothetical protein [Hydrogenophaga sp. 5NK40-0174]|uniref:hypothetical protein n=1 Tax=Hydrogenophaga sp. 5NK40-0174 TaxID=3127649 RepID=UPI0031080734